MEALFRRMNALTFAYRRTMANFRTKRGIVLDSKEKNFPSFVPPADLGIEGEVVGFGIFE